jgi:hypothetical protein
VLRQLPRRRPHSSRFAIAATAAVLAASSALTAPAASASPDIGVPQARPGATAAAKPLLLINGDILSVRAQHDAVTATLTAEPDHDPLWSLHTGSASYEFPVDAVPYLGRGLDASLFDVTALQRLESGGRLPVRLSYTGAVPGLPGVTITSSGNGTATGYLTAASAAVFGRALARQFAAGHRSGSYAAAGLFAGVSISLAGVHVPAPVRPGFTMHPLTVTATNKWGKADSGDLVLVLNADNLETFGDPNEAFNVFYRGSAKYSVPAGHYWALADFFASYRKAFSQRLVVLPQFTVAGDSTTVHVAAAAATSEVTFSTPRPAVSALVDWTILRYGKHGPPADSGTISLYSPTWISPTKARPSVGTIASYTFAQLFSPPKTKGTPYDYNLDFSGPPGIVPGQHFTVSSANTATVNEKFYDNARAQGSVLTAGGNSAQLTQFVMSIGVALNVPGEQTEYISGGPSYAWMTSFFASNGPAEQDSLHTLLNGRTYTENWNQYPLHPQAVVQLLSGTLGALAAQLPSAFRVGNEVWFTPYAFSGNDPQFGHLGEAFYTGTFRLRDGKSAAGGDFYGSGHLKVASSPSSVRFSLSVLPQPDPLSTLSQATYTVWTVPTAASPGAVVPRSWYCFDAKFNITQHCAVLPMMTLDYQVRRLGLDGVAPAGAQQLTVGVGHAQLSKQSAVVSARAQVSWDGGLFWYRAAVARISANRYLVSFTPPPGVDVTLKFMAADAAGGSVTETITDAYAVGPAS